MARTILKVAAGALLMLVLVAGAGRYAAGALVASDAFREATGRQIEKSLRPFIPEALVAIEESQLAGVGELVLRRVSVRSELKIDAVVTVPELRLKPRWTTVFWPGRTELDATAKLAGDGTATLALVLPLKVMIRGEGDADAEVTGAFERADAPSIMALALASGRGRAPHLARGLVDGEVAIAKGVGEARATARKTGRATLRFYDAAYAVKDREETLSPFEAVLDLRDYTVKFAEPCLVETSAHDARVLVAGRLHLPHRAEQALGWDLELDTDGRPGFKDELAQIFRCENAPVSKRFRVVGPVAEARCQAMVAASAKKDIKGL